MKITIFHTNDIHSNYSTLKRIHAYLKQKKGRDDLYLDSGDYTDLKDLIVQSDMGSSALDLLLSCGIDAMAVGNNEIDLGKENLNRVAVKLPMLSCNLTDAYKNPLPNVLSSIIIEKAGVKFLIIGISPYYTDKMEDSKYNGFFYLYNLLTHPSLKEIKRIIDENKNNYDYCILLSHNGYNVEKQIMKEIPQIDLCLGGHSHSVTNYKGYSSSGRGEYLGIIVLDIKDSGIEEISNELIKLPDCEDEEFDELMKTKEALADKILSQDIGALENLNFDSLKENDLTNFVCDCLYDRFEGDFAIMHNGIAEDSLLRPVSKKSLIQIFPSKLNPAMYKISGDKILDAIVKSFDDDFIRQSGIGAGFRGHVLGTLSYSHNVRISLDPFHVYINGQELDPNRTYSIITDDYLQRGTGYSSMAVPDNEAEWDVWFIRDLVQHYIKDDRIYKSCKVKRIVQSSSH